MPKNVNSYDKKEDYPEEAVEIGTFVRVNRLNMLGIVTDAFYGDTDIDNTQIIVYTVFLLPQKKFSHIYKEEDKFYMINEYEYDVTAYLMMKPVDVDKVLSKFERGTWLED